MVLPEIAAAHLFGLFRNVGLLATARGLAVSAELRSRADTVAAAPDEAGKVIEGVAAEASRELEERTKQLVTGVDAPYSVLIGSGGITVQVDLSVPLIDLAHRLIRATESRSAMAALLEADATLDVWNQARPPRDRRVATLQIGAEVRDVTPL
jgi:hypothetical protein